MRPHKFDYAKAARLYVDEQLSLQAVAAQLGVGTSAVRYALLVLGVPRRSIREAMALVPSRHVVQHDTVNEYANFGCRCEPCRLAHTEYLMLLQPCPSCGGRKSFDAEFCQKCSPSWQPKHGLTRYRKGCRCEVCRAAASAQKRGQRARNADHYREYWRRRKERAS